jgi:hypothetical protein
MGLHYYGSTVRWIVSALNDHFARIDLYEHFIVEELLEAGHGEWFSFMIEVWRSLGKYFL